MAKTKTTPRALSDRTQPVAQTIMGKAPAPKQPAQKPVHYNTVLGGSRGK